MIGMVLAAGAGRRLGPDTADLPKTLLPVDGDRTMWPWRDWVVEAFNRNMPFDQFTIQQIAGEL